MSRPKNQFPTYSKHPRHNSARCWLDGRWVNLGPWDSPASRAEYARVCAALAAGRPAPAPTGPVTVDELVAAFRVHAEAYYVRPDGTQTNEVSEFRAALKVVRRLYGDTPARDFGPLALQAVRAAMVEGEAAGGVVVREPWCRTRVNAQVRRVRRAWKWAAAQELVPGSTVAGLAAVAGLRRGRSAARETAPKRPVPEADYLAALPHLLPTVRGMVRLQRLAGLRPCEVRLLTPADLDRSGEVWVYRPAEHKMSHAGRAKAVPLSPSARAVVEPWLAGLGPDDLVFTPVRLRQERYAALRAARRSKVQPSQRSRAKLEAEKVRRVPARFTDAGYGDAVARACAKAGVPAWTPGQLRHSFATEVRARFGLEVAQVLLGHAHAAVSEVYAERDLAAGIAAAKAMG